MLALGVVIALSPTAAAQNGPQSLPSSVHRTQLPPPFGAEPNPQLPRREQCTADDRKRLEAQVEAYQKLQGLARNEGEQICTMVENSENLGKLADGRMIERLLPPEARDFLKALGVDFTKTDMKAVLKMLGVDLDQLDMRKIKAQCRMAQGDADRMFTSEIGRLKRELLECNDTI
jgi:hypothetical protein